MELVVKCQWSENYKKIQIDEKLPETHCPRKLYEIQMAGITLSATCYFRGEEHFSVFFLIYLDPDKIRRQVDYNIITRATQ